MGENINQNTVEILMKLSSARYAVDYAKQAVEKAREVKKLYESINDAKAKEQTKKYIKYTNNSVNDAVKHAEQAAKEFPSLTSKIHETFKPATRKQAEQTGDDVKPLTLEAVQKHEQDAKQARDRIEKYFKQVKEISDEIKIREDLTMLLKEVEIGYANVKQIKKEFDEAGNNSEEAKKECFDKIRLIYRSVGGIIINARNKAHSYTQLEYRYSEKGIAFEREHFKKRNEKTHENRNNKIKLDRDDAKLGEVARRLQELNSEGNILWILKKMEKYSDSIEDVSNSLKPNGAMIFSLRRS